MNPLGMVSAAGSVVRLGEVSSFQLMGVSQQCFIKCGTQTKLTQVVIHISATHSPRMISSYGRICSAGCGSCQSVGTVRWALCARESVRDAVELVDFSGDVWQRVHATLSCASWSGLIVPFRSLRRHSPLIVITKKRAGAHNGISSSRERCHTCAQHRLTVSVSSIWSLSSSLMNA